MMDDRAESGSGYLVLVNDVGDYSLWLEFRDVPVGWRPTGFRGSEEECAEHVDGLRGTVHAHAG